MRELGWRMWWLLASAVACSAGACSQSADDPIESGAGRGNEGGSDTEAGAGAGGSDAGVVAGAEGGSGDECKTPEDLTEYCSTHICPETPDDVDLGYCDSCTDEYPRVTRGMSSCGGVSVSRSTMFAGSTYHFDGDDHLVGVSWGGDADYCLYRAGRECTVQGVETTLCGDLDRCDAVGLQYRCDAPDACSAFDNPEMIQQQLCGAGDVVERFASSCDGSVFRHQSGATVNEWSFDAEGELVGIVVASDTSKRCLDGGYSKVAVYGRPCEAMGDGNDQCGAGGQGMGGTGGASGSGGAQ